MEESEKEIPYWNYCARDKQLYLPAGNNYYR